MKYNLLFYALLFFTLSCTAQNSSQSEKNVKESSTEMSDAQLNELDKAIFAGGCFWCVEAVFERVEGVEAAVSGYSGGELDNPTYEQVSSGRTKHAEAVMVYYNSEVVTYDQLLEVFFAAHDPTQLNRQGPDVGPQYRSAIFYLNDDQKKAANAFIMKKDKSGKYKKPIVTEITEAGEFYDAENYHQDYYEQHPSNPYIQKVSRPKVEKFIKNYPELLKEEYKKISSK